LSSHRFTTDEIIIILDVFKASIKDGLDLKFILEELQDTFGHTGNASAIQDMGQRIFSHGMISEGFRGIMPDNIVEAIGLAYEKGHLDVVLQEIQTIYELKRRLAQQLKKAIAYPALVIGLFFVFTVAAFVFLMPRIEASFKGADPKKIPEFSKMLFSISQAMRDHYILFAVALAGIGIFVYFMFNNYRDKILSKIPLIKDIMQSQENAMSFQMIAVFHQAGVNIQKAFFSVSESLTGKFRNIFTDTSKMLSEGKTITEAFEKNKVAKKYLVRVKSGEITGKIDDAFEKISLLEQQKMELQLSTLSKAINIIMLLLAGLSAIGFYAVTLLPIYKMAGM
jgi:type II secretory pathway component PulF